MKYILTLGNVTLEAYETSDRNYLNIRRVPVSKKQLEAIGFKLEPKMDTQEVVRHLRRKFGVSLETLGEHINKMRRVL